MPKFKAYAAAIVLPGLLMSGAAFGAPEDASTKQCQVTVDRSQAAGTYDVTRQVFEDGNCICYVYTGPKPQADTIESAISELLNTRSCADAKVQNISGPLAGAGAAGLGAGLGGAGAILPVVAGAGAAAAIAIASDDDPASP